TGKRLDVLGDPGRNGDVRLSPDGKRLAVSLPEPTKGTSDIWLYDIARRLRTRFTFDPASELTSIWSPDSTHLVFNSNRKGHLDLYRKDASGSGAEELVLASDQDKVP